MGRPVTPVRSDAESRQRSGVLFAIAAYGIWGAFPLYFLLLAPAGAVEIVAWRILFSLAFCIILLTVTRKWSAFVAILRRPRMVFTIGLAGVLIYANWQVYVFGVLSGQVVEASLGYFINPILTVLLGVVILRERLRPLQWVAVGISIGAITVLVIGLGSIPWIALALAATFGLYGLIKKRAGVSVDAVTGLTLETLWLVPVASALLLVVDSTTGIVFGTISLAHSAILLSAGVATAIPLLLFASAARRLSLVGLGLIQYLTPILQFSLGVFVLHEAMPVERWIGFALVWVALIVLTWDLFAHGRAARRSLPLPA